MIYLLWPFRNATIIKINVDAIVGLTTKLSAGLHGFETWPSQTIFLFSKMSTPSLRPTKPTTEWV